MAEINLIQPIGNDKGDQHADRYAHKRIFDCVPKNQPEILIRKDFDIILHPNGFFCTEKVPFQRGDIKRLKRRIKPDCYVKDQWNSQKQPGGNRQLLPDRQLVPEIGHMFGFSGYEKNRQMATNRCHLHRLQAMRVSLRRIRQRLPARLSQLSSAPPQGLRPEAPPCHRHQLAIDAAASLTRRLLHWHS